MTKDDAEKEISNIKKQIREHERLYFENKETEDSVIINMIVFSLG